MAGEYEQTIFVLKRRLATEVLAEFDFIYWPAIPRSPRRLWTYASCIGGWSYIQGGLGLVAGPPGGKMICLYIIWLLAAPGKGKLQGTQQGTHQGTQEGS